MIFRNLLLDKRDFGQDKYLVFLAIAAFIAGLFFRFWDLGGAPLAVDEYFLGTSTLNTAKYGLPQFDCGGYYTRGVLLQYLTLPLLALGANLEFAVRFWPAIASILSILAVWRIALLLGGTRIALIAVILMSLSVWEVEFARFGRMYAPFQAAFLWYLYFQIQHLINGDTAARWWYLGISALSIFIYEGAVLLLAFNLLALIWPGKRWTIVHLSVAFTLLIAALKIRSTNFRYLESAADQASSTLSQNSEMSLPDVSRYLPIDLPNLPQSILPIVAMGLCLFGFAIWRYRDDIRINHPAAIFWFIALLSFCGGFIALGIALVLAGRFMVLPSPIPDITVRPRSIIGSLAALSSLWFVVIIFAFRLSETGITIPTIRDALGYLFNFPDVYYKIVTPWMQTVPFTSLSLMILAAVALGLTLKSSRGAPPAARIAGYLFGALILQSLLVALIPLPYATTRYTYFLYPLLIILASVGINTIVGTRVTKPGSRILVVVSLMIPLFVIAEDFRLSHLVRINEPEIRYRTNYSSQLAEHYYARWDFRSTAFHVDANLLPDDNVIVFDQPLPHYLTRTTGIFIREGSGNYRIVQGCGGERDLWSNVPMLTHERDVQQLIDETKGRVWIIVRTDKYTHRDPLESALIEQYKLNPEFVSQDGHLAAYVIDTP
jgi:hypothetical protein